MNITGQALTIRNILKATKDFKTNPIDLALPVIPVFNGTGVTKLIIIGQDPTVKNAMSRKKITCTLNLDKNNALTGYVKRICGIMGIEFENVYATNLFKYFYTYPPAATPEVLKAHLQLNLELLKKELNTFDGIPVITFGEPVLQLLTSKASKVSKYWDYNARFGKTNGSFKFAAAEDNKLQRIFFPFPHQPSIRKVFYTQTLHSYVDFLKNTDTQLLKKIMK